MIMSKNFFLLPIVVFIWFILFVNIIPFFMHMITDQVDSNNIYYQKGFWNIYYSGMWWPIPFYRKIKDVDVDSFEIIYLTWWKNWEEQIYSDYVKDKNKIFYWSLYEVEELKEVDYNSFLVTNKWIWLDKNGVYIWSKKITGIDTKTFKYLGSGYSKDKDYVYYHGEKVKGADASTFEHLEAEYWKDKEHLIFVGKVIENSDISSLDFDCCIRFEDKKNIYRRVKNNLEID